MPTKPVTRKKPVKQKPLEPSIAEAEAKAEAKPANPEKDIVIGDAPKVGTTTPKMGTEAASGGTEESPAESVTEPKAALPLPKHLQDQIDALNTVFSNVQKEVEAFKNDQAYLSGDIPVALRGISGPGLAVGQRSLNYINVAWLDPGKHFRWSNKKMVDYHRGDGFTPEDFDDFSLMVKARGGGHNFEKTPEGHVMSGDLIMVATSQSWYEQLKARNERLVGQREKRAKSTIYQAGEKFGVDVYEGDEATKGARMSRLIDYLEKTLGPGAAEAYLGG